MARDSMIVPPVPEETRWASRESTRRLIFVGLEIVLLLIVVIALEVIVSRANTRFDLTPEQLKAVA